MYFNLEVHCIITIYYYTIHYYHIHIIITRAWIYMNKMY